MQRNEFQSPHLKVKKGEYECPLCRQLGNSVIPCIPSYEESSQALVLAQRSHEDIVKELTRIVSLPGLPRFGVSIFNLVKMPFEDFVVYNTELGCIRSGEIVPINQRNMELAVSETFGVTDMFESE